MFTTVLAVVLYVGIVATVFALANNPRLRGCLPFVGAPGDCGRVTEITNAPNELTWLQRHEGPGLAALFAVAYANEQFVAVGEQGLIATSADGLTWSTHTVQPSVMMTSVTFGHGLWVAVSNRGTIMTSADAVTWASQEILGQPSFDAVAYGSGRFVVVGLGGNYVSEDALTWTRASDGRALSGVIWDGERFRVTGVNWSVATSSYGAGYASQHVETWLFRPQFTRSDHHLRSMARGPDRYVVVGGDERSGNILVSEDGEHWRQHLWVNQTMRRVIYANGQFVAAADRWLLTSADGLEWTPYRVPNGPVYDVAYGNDRYVAVGGSGRILSSK